MTDIGIDNNADLFKRQKISNSYLSQLSNSAIDLSQFRVNLNHFDVGSKHPLGIKPKGNYLMSISCSKDSLNSFKKDRKKNLGHFSDWNYEQILDFVKNYIDDPQTLLNLQISSRMFYGILHEEDIWRNLYMKEYEILEEKHKNSSNTTTVITPFKNLGASEIWLGSWRRTLLGITNEKEEAMIQSNDLIFSDDLYRPFQNKKIKYKKIFKKIIELEKINYQEGNNANLIFNIERFSEAEFYDKENFVRKYSDRPFILQNTLAEDSYKLDKIDSLTDILPSGSQFRQETVKWPLEKYIQYFYNNSDESPLYLFDCNKELLSTLNQCYQKPKFSKTDFFDLFKETRPDHLWIITGPENSGSTFHKDPNSTSAWNQLLSGMKLWIMLPPDVSPPGVIADADEENVTAPLSLSEWVNSGFFNDCIKLCEQNTSEKTYCLIGCTFPGETIYVPSNWWHSVINLEDSIAMTGNFVPHENLFKVLFFFQHKKLQISGFHLKNLIESMQIFYNENQKTLQASDDAVESVLPVFENFLHSQETINLLKNLDDEDCGVLEDYYNNILKEIPIYEFFILLISLNENYKQYLDDSLTKLHALEMFNNTQNGPAIKESTIWKNLTKKQDSHETGNPLFGFSFSDDASSGDDF